MPEAVDPPVAVRGAPEVLELHRFEAVVEQGVDDVPRALGVPAFGQPDRVPDRVLHLRQVGGHRQQRIGGDLVGQLAFERVHALARVLLAEQPATVDAAGDLPQLRGQHGLVGVGAVQERLGGGVLLDGQRPAGLATPGDVVGSRAAVADVAVEGQVATDRRGDHDPAVRSGRARIGDRRRGVGARYGRGRGNRWRGPWATRVGHDHRVVVGRRGRCRGARRRHISGYGDGRRPGGFSLGTGERRPVRRPVPGVGPGTPGEYVVDVVTAAGSVRLVALGAPGVDAGGTVVRCTAGAGIVVPAIVGYPVGGEPVVVAEVG